MEQFINVNSKYLREFQVPGLPDPLKLDRDFLWHIGEKFLKAIMEASRIYQHIKMKKGSDFIAEVSMDEVEEAQSPVELLMILSGLAIFGVELQTIAPKFTGRFNKGVDYSGDIEAFKKEFEEDLLVIDFAVKEFSLPDNLKLSVHSGSDKFSIYGPIHDLLTKHNKGLHVKTAGTTWLEEIAGLAKSGGPGLIMAKEIYANAYARFEELTGPYATVIDIPRDALPLPEEVSNWDKEKYYHTLNHDPGNMNYNPAFRQLLHVAYKVAAELGQGFLDQLEANQETIGQLVTGNILNKHIRPIFNGISNV